MKRILWLGGDTVTQQHIDLLNGDTPSPLLGISAAYLTESAFGNITYWLLEEGEKLDEARAKYDRKVKSGYVPISLKRPKVGGI